jgi:hypothetical protein
VQGWERLVEDGDFEIEALKAAGSSKFVKKEDLPEVRKQIKNYERMKLLTDTWIELATELSNLRIAKRND